MLGETLLNPIIDYRLNWTKSLQQATSLRWAFVVCTEIAYPAMHSLIGDFETIIRTDLRFIYRWFPTAPVALIFEISSNVTNLTTLEKFTNDAYVISDIEFAHFLLKRLEQGTYNSSNSSSQIAVEPIDTPLVFKWYRLTDNFLKSTASHAAATTILSVLFKPNISTHNIRQIVPDLLYFPRTSIEGTYFVEDYPTFRDRNEVHFVTCDPAGMSALSLKDLSSSFDNLTWLFLFLSAIVTTAVVVFVYRVQHVQISLYHHVTFVYTILLSQSAPEKYCNNKIILSCWLFVMGSY